MLYPAGFFFRPMVGYIYIYSLVPHLFPVLAVYLEQYQLTKLTLHPTITDRFHLVAFLLSPAHLANDLDRTCRQESIW